MLPDISALLKKITQNFKSGDFKASGGGIVDRDTIDRKQYDFKVPTQDRTYETPKQEPYTLYDPSLYDFQDKAPFPQELLPYVESASSKYSIEPSVLASLLASETGGLANPYDINAVSEAGAYGIGQVIPGYHYQAAGYPTIDDYQRDITTNPEFAIAEAGRILREYLDQAGEGNYYDALSAYNAGFGNIDAGRPYAQEVLNRVNFPVNNILN